MKEFLATSSIHGVRYLGMNQWYERVCWTVICILSLMFCATQIYGTLIKWKNDPINIVLDKEFTPIKEVIFPTLTFCGQRRPNQTIFNYSRILEDENESPFEGFTINKLKLFEYMSETCFYYITQSKGVEAMKLKNFPSKGHYNSMEDFEYLKKSLPKGEFIVNNCNDNTRGTVDLWDCGQSFYWMLTLDGVCYTFNMKPKKDIFRPDVIYFLSELPFGMEENSSKVNKSSSQTESRQYPFKFTNSRHYFQFSTTLYRDFEDQNCYTGLNLYLQRSDELLWEPMYNYRLQAEQHSYIRIGIKQSQVVTSPDLRQFSAEQRQCYFDDERPLKYFLKYSKSSCELECYADQTQKNCNCTLIWMPHFLNATICSALDIECVDNIFAFNNCDCLSDCNSVTYSATIQNVWDVKPSKDDLHEKPHSTLIIEFYYTEYDILLMRRVRAYTFTDFVAQIGGIFGLFLGCSILSFIEIIYFCTVRVLLKIKETVA